MSDVLFSNIYLAMTAWAAVYCLDWVLTIAGARAYHLGADKHLVFEKGYELTPFFRKDVAHLRWISPRFVFVLVVSTGAIWILGMLFRLAPDLPDALERAYFSFLVGGFVLMESVVCVRHLRNLVLFSQLAQSRGVEGRLWQSMGLSLRVSSVEILGFVGLFFICWLLSPNPCFLGAMAFLAVQAVKQRRWARSEPATVANR